MGHPGNVGARSGFWEHVWTILRRHPFRFLTTLVVSLIVWFISYLFMASVSSGFRFGPGEFVSVDSETELREDGFFEQGAEWPGSEVHLHASDDGYLLERHWLGWSEVLIPVTDDFGFDTASYRYGTGEYVQRRIGDATALGVGLLTYLFLWRLWVRRREIGESEEKIETTRSRNFIVVGEPERIVPWYDPDTSIAWLWTLEDRDTGEVQQLAVRVAWRGFDSIEQVPSDVAKEAFATRGRTGVDWFLEHQFGWHEIIFHSQSRSPHGSTGSSPIVRWDERS